jgi:hypothetical protein
VGVCESAAQHPSVSLDESDEIDTFSSEELLEDNSPSIPEVISEVLHLFLHLEINRSSGTKN